jgi:hypothetical protein
MLTVKRRFYMGLIDWKTLFENLGAALSADSQYKTGQ